MERAERGVEPEPCVVGGLLVECRHPLPGLPSDGFHDGRVGVSLVAQPSSDPGRWLGVPLAGAVRVQVRADGSELEAAAAGARPEAVATAVKAAVPFAAALQTKVTLHAAAIAWGDTTVAVVGASGSGKSTLAESLASAGLPVVADDLLPCRLEDHRVVAPSSPDPSGGHALVPLAGVFFLERRPVLAEPNLQELGARACFEQLVRHGFGEIADRAAWSAQVDVYHHIADQLPAFEMTIPDDLGRQDEMARWFEATCRREFE